ncbi:hypothetical protein BGZ73_008293 [Actinomortierella ambigua]|nr:hypothetical protein BGZ73_008293 [Actinomortierella ambigua]
MQRCSSIGPGPWTTALHAASRLPPPHRPLQRMSRLSTARGPAPLTSARSMSFLRPKKLARRVVYQPTSPTTWIISDGNVSAEKEAIVLAKGLKLPWEIKRVEWRKGLQWLPMPFKKMIMDYHHAVTPLSNPKQPWFLTGDSLQSPFPSFVIGCGSKTIPGVVHVSRKSGKASYSVMIHFPALPFIHFDQVLLQKHEITVQLGRLGVMKDQKNYIQISSSLNNITQSTLEAAKKLAQDNRLIPASFFSAPKSKQGQIVSVLVGGPGEDCLGVEADRLASRLARLVHVQQMRVLLTFSPRTTDRTKKELYRLAEQINDPAKFFIYDPAAAAAATATQAPSQQQAIIPRTSLTLAGYDPAQNPYEAMLALADKIVVTADSVQMTNEALATGKPVYVVGSEMARGKLKVFHRLLADQHMTRAFRPGRVHVTPLEAHPSEETHPGTSGMAKKAKKSVDSTHSSSSGPLETADPLSYPGDHPPWRRTAFVGLGLAEASKLGDHLQSLREARISGRRAPTLTLDTNIKQ